MKLLSFLFGLGISSLALAQSISISTDDVTIRIPGRGAHVCSAQAMSSDRPVLARGESLFEAKALALQECQMQGNGFFCKVKECERDVVNGSLVDVIFDVSRGDVNVGVSFKGKVKYACVVEAWNKTYFAKAATKVEAKVLVTNECANGNNDNAFFCDVGNRDCKMISGVSGRFSFRGLLDGLINN